MVDHLEFESPALIDQFLKFWRQSGYQRFGYMYGRYEPYSEIPLGVKAIVSAIYEPPQQTEPDSIQVDMNDPQDALIEEFASLLGLNRIGIIYSDLLDDGTGTGNVICKRHGESYFLSSGECIFSGYMQHKHPLPCKYSRTGKFGSRFMTCVLTGKSFLFMRIRQ
jgi:nuclear protein localization family protein 4